MKRPLSVLALSILMLPYRLDAQTVEHDPRIEMLDYASARSWSLNTALGKTSLIMLVPGEHIQTVEMSDPSAYQLSVTAARDGIYLRPRRPAARGTMAIDAGARRYTIELIADPGLPAPYVMSFRDRRLPTSPTSTQSPIPATVNPPGSYKLIGDRSLRPVSVRDDGSKTYIRWAADQSIPAVFAVEGAGREETINGYMREGVFTIDRIYDRLIFRLDKAAAYAMRSTAKRPS